MADSSLQNEMSIESSYLDFPLYIKYRADRLNNVRPYLMGGLNFRYDMSSKKSYDSDKEIYIRLKPADLYLEMGVGMDFYLQYFKFSPEIKLSRGMFNALVDDTTAGKVQYFNSINKMNSYIVMISFHFE
jgi:outer membrane protein with beta-barrel domain